MDGFVALSVFCFMMKYIAEDADIEDVADGGKLAGNTINMQGVTDE